MLSVDPDGWLRGIRRRPSPHADERPAGSRIELVVLHGVSLPPGEFGGPWVEAFFAGDIDPHAHPFFEEIRDLRVAPHILVRRTGEIIQFVSCLRRAWHAGRSSWRGRVECNDYSVGIELEGTDDTPYEEAQYDALARVLSALLEAYPALGEDALAGHSDVAPGRKTDPGPAFAWERLSGRLALAGYNFRRRSTPEREGFRA